jgi:hypothetical protein
MKDATTSPALDVATLALPPLTAPSQAGEAWLEPAATLPRDHPAWQRDVLSISARIRAIVAQLRPLTVRVLTFWDHTLRSVSINGRRLEVDPSGCYRLLSP